MKPKTPKRPEQFLIDECDPEVIDYIQALENKYRIDQTDFEEWWYLIGSGLRPKNTDDMETHGKKVAESFLKHIQWKQNTIPLHNTSKNTLDIATHGGSKGY